MTDEACVMCGASDSHGTILLTRPRPLHRSEYQICLPCARRVKEEQDRRAMEAVEMAERAGV